MVSYNLTVKENVLKKEMYYKDHLILSYTIKYPQFVSDKFRLFLTKLNIHYKADAALYQKIHISKLYQMAVDDYEYSVTNGFPIHQYEVNVEYKVTYNENCILSLYFDRYEFTGGAHGTTKRNSDTWDLRKGIWMELTDFLPDNKNAAKYIQAEIIGQIEEEIKKGNNIFFEDYADLVKENFNSRNFYLAKEGIAVYFQLYEIAPYVSGIQTFIIPYAEGAAVLPKC